MRQTSTSLTSVPLRFSVLLLLLLLFSLLLVVDHEADEHVLDLSPLTVFGVGVVVVVFVVGGGAVRGI